MPRPTALTAIGLLFIIFGAMALGGALLSLAAWGAMSADGLVLMSDTTFPFPMIGFVFRNFVVLLLAQLAVSIAMIAGGAGMLAMRPWSRPLLEGISWLALAGIAVFAIIWMGTLLRVGAELPSGEGFPAFGIPFMVIAGLFSFVLSAAVPIAMIWVLRRPSVRSALEPAPA